MTFRVRRETAERTKVCGVDHQDIASKRSWLETEPVVNHCGMVTTNLKGGKGVRTLTLRPRPNLADPVTPLS